MAASGIKWTTASTAVTTGLQFLQLAVLARILDPTAFGLMGMVMVVIGFAQAFADMGVSNAIIHRQDATKEQLSSLYWLNIFAGSAVFFLIWGAIPLIVAFYNEPQLSMLMQWAALIFLITPIGQQFQILLQKELKFNQLARIEMLAAFIGTLVAIFTAYYGFGVMALVWGQLANTTVRTLNLAFQGWRSWAPRLHFSRHDLKGYIGFGLYQMGERIINYFNSNLDYLVIGRFLGAEALGFYTLAYNLVIIPSNKINPIITRVAFPVFAKVQHQQDRLKSGYLEVLKVLSFINFPLLLGLLVTAPLVVPQIFGPEWLPSVILIKILSGVGLLRLTGNPIGALLLAKGRADLGFKWNMMLTVTQLPGILIGAYFGGVIGVAIAYLVLQCIYAVFNYLILIRKLLGFCLREYLNSMWPAFLYSSVMALGVAVIGKILVHFSSALILVIEIFCGMLIYLILWLLFKREEIVNFKQLALSKHYEEKAI